MIYRSILVTARGGLEAVRVVEKELGSLAAGQARIKVLAAPVCQDDVAARVGNRPFLPKVPFVPGYAFLGRVEETGEGVSSVFVGDRVAALTNYGSHAEHIDWPADQLVHVPPDLDPAEGVVLLLNYLTAYQAMHRVAGVQAGDRVLIIGASGGVGTALLQLGRLAGLHMYGLASPAKHGVLRDHGATPIDYRSQDFVQVIRQAESEGLDYVFNGMTDEYFERGLAVLRRGGVLVHYGGPESLGGLLRLVVRLVLYTALPNGKTVKGYGTHREDISLFKKDWNKLFGLLESGQIRPVVQAKLPLLQAARAYELLEAGGVTGNLVLLAPEVL